MIYLVFGFVFIDKKPTVAREHILLLIKFDLIVLSQLQIILNNNLLIVPVVCSETHNVTRHCC